MLRGSTTITMHTRGSLPEQTDVPAGGVHVVDVWTVAARLDAAGLAAGWLQSFPSLRNRVGLVLVQVDGGLTSSVGNMEA